jgi:hypothetical protein
LLRDHPVSGTLALVELGSDGVENASSPPIDGGRAHLDGLALRLLLKLPGRQLPSGFDDGFPVVHGAYPEPSPRNLVRAREV